MAPSSAEPGGEPVTVRPARRGDVDALVALEEAAFASERISRRSFLRLIGRPTALVLVAERAAELVGSAVALFRSYSDRARLYSIAAMPGAGGKGIGSGLLRQVEADARRRGCRAVALEVRADNAAAIGLYERRGYRRLGRTEGYYADGAAAIHYLKLLAEAGAPPQRGAAA